MSSESETSVFKFQCLFWKRQSEKVMQRNAYKKPSQLLGYADDLYMIGWANIFNVWKENDKDDNI